jgi:hypothetical protein
VEYAETEEAFLTGSADEITKVAGTKRCHSELLYVFRFSYDPIMGAPNVDAESIRKLQDTSPWAYDKVTLEHYANWYNVTSVKSGQGDYNNPYMYYDTPLLHVAYINGLKPAKTYYYRVSGSCKVFKFRVPPYYLGAEAPPPDVQMYPFKVGLMGDVGQTDVSVGTFEAMLDYKPDAALLVGDLSYAGAYDDFWSSSK